MLPSSVERVPRNTSEAVNRRIESEARARVRRIASRPEQIRERLRELDEEWDTERFMEAHAAVVAFTGTALALGVDRRFAYIPLVVSAFLFQHAVQGWCPPLPIVRRLGFRTPEEIDEERYALKLLRGDFDDAERMKTPESAYNAVAH